MSMEEEQARQAAAEQANAQTSASSAPPESIAEEPATEPAEPTDDENDAMLQHAIAMSEGDVEMEGQDEEDISEEEAIARAIEMSMKDTQGDEGKDKK